MTPSTESLPARQPLVLFMHIPKTGGTTLENMICAEYPDQEGRVAFFEPGFCLGEPDLRRQMAATAAKLEPDVWALTGHFDYGLHRYIPRACTYLTLLRDPVDRVLSLYAHFFRWGDDRHGVRRRNLTLQQFITDVDCPDVENGQTRRLCGSEAVGLPDEDRLRLAQARLSGGSIVAGLTERHRESVTLFSRILGWRGEVPSPALVNSQRPARESIPAQVIRQIMRLNTLDYELLEHARSLLSARI